jgi:hypothetical protein
VNADKPIYSNLAGDGRYQCGITGAGSSAPTKRFGDGITVTRQAEGVYRFAFANHLGYFRGVTVKALGADTPGDVKGHTVTRAAYVAPSGTTPAYVQLSVWDSSFAADDLEATEYLDVEFAFSTLSVG